MLARLVMLSFSVLGISAASAQQTLFNVPSHDVLDKGQVYVELDAPCRPNNPRFLYLTPRVVVGLGEKMEGGFNLPGYVTPGTPAYALHATLKRVENLSDAGPTLNVGIHLAMPISSSNHVGAFGYSSIALKPSDPLRLSLGGYAATSAFTNTSTAAGVLGGIECVASPWLMLMAEGYSGSNALSAISPGIMLTLPGDIVVYAAYQFFPQTTSSNSVLLEFGRVH